MKTMKTATFFKSVSRKNNRQIFAFNQAADILFFHTSTSTCEITGLTNCNGIIKITDRQGKQLDLDNSLLSKLYEKALNFNVQTDINQ